MRYSKPHLPFSAQIQLLHQRGLQIDDPGAAEAFLERTNYYRLSAYFRPFYASENAFRPGTRFEDIAALYEADSRLRHWLSVRLERWEIRFRTQCAYWHAQKYGSDGYADATHFHPGFRNTHPTWLEKNLADFRKSKEVFAAHFASKYSHSPHPPLWMLCETMTFGSTSHLLKGLDGDLQRTLSDALGVSKEVLVSWAHAMVYLRNLSAHHCRVWNRKLAVQAMVPRKWAPAEFATDRIFRMASVLEYLERRTMGRSYADSWSELLSAFPSELHPSMGVPSNWRDLWDGWAMGAGVKG